jgi:hypothetical protein
VQKPSQVQQQQVWRQQHDELALRDRAPRPLWLLAAAARRWYRSLALLYAKK